MGPHRCAADDDGMSLLAGNRPGARSTINSGAPERVAPSRAAAAPGLADCGGRSVSRECPPVDDVGPNQRLRLVAELRLLPGERDGRYRRTARPGGIRGVGVDFADRPVTELDVAGALAVEAAAAVPRSAATTVGDRRLPLTNIPARGTARRRSRPTVRVVRDGSPTSF